MTGIFKEKLVYDSTTPADADSVAAFLRTSSGPLTSTGAAGALDVNITNSLTVNSDGVYDSPSNTSPDSSGLILNERGATLDETTQTYRTSGGVANADAVVAANVHGLDANSFMMGFNGTTWDRLKSENGSLLAKIEGQVADDAVDAGNPLKVGSRAISGLLGSVAAGDRADMISDVYRRLYVNDTPNVAGSNAAVSVDTTAGGVAIFASPLPGRRIVKIQNLGTKAIYLGYGTVTAANGTRLSAQATEVMEIGPDLALKGIAESGSQDVRVMQIA